MSARQLITPNLNPVISEDGKVLTDWWGWCLAYIQNALGVGWAGSTATDCWDNHTVNRHADSNLPSGVWIPIFFSGYGGQGHAALYKDGLVYSSPWHHKAAYDEMSSIAETERIYNVTYVGWAEGLAGRQVIELVADAPAPPTFTTDIQPFTGTYTVSGDKWNLNLSNFDTIAANPVSGIPSVPVTFTAQLKRSDLPQYTYYLEDANVHQGYNSLDCQPYTPPVVAAPYIPPAAPVTVALAETYKLLTALPYYVTMNDLQANRNSAGTLPAGTYYVLAKNGNNDIYYNVTTTNMSNVNHWINILDNKVVVVPPVVDTPAPKPVVTLTPKVETSSEVMHSFSWFDPSKEHKPVVYKIEKSIKVYDQVHTGQAILIEAGKDIEVYGTFTKDGYIYLRPLTSLDEQGMYYYYGIVTTDIYSGAPYLSKETTQGDTVYYDAELYINKAVKTLEGVFRWLKRK